MIRKAMPPKPDRSDRRGAPGVVSIIEGPLQELLGFQLARARVAADQVFRREVGEPKALRPVEYTLLALIAGNPGIGAARLARALSVTKPNITMWIDRLEARGLAKRRTSRTDARVVALVLTAAGNRLAEQATRRLLAGEAKQFRSLSAVERAVLVQLLRKVAAAPDAAPARARRRA